jgi:hypothetical protein
MGIHTVDTGNRDTFGVTQGSFSSGSQFSQSFRQFFYVEKSSAPEFEQAGGRPAKAGTPNFMSSDAMTRSLH